jgi:hypothetical protein
MALPFLWSSLSQPPSMPTILQALKVIKSAVGHEGLVGSLFNGMVEGHS